MNLKTTALPIWTYLNQQLCDRRSVWNLKRFWYLYRIELLKKCWQRELSQESRPHH